MKIDDEFDEALQLARKHDEERDGMASVGIVYDPYEGQWVAKASWSDSTTVEAADKTPSRALASLCDELKDM